MLRLGKKEFCDATIVCNGKQYAVHRLILSLGSNFFRNIFAEISSSEPLIIIDGIENSLLEKTLLFMYTGKVYINKESTASFLRAAQSLHVKGLTDIATSNSSMATKVSNECYNLQLKFDEMCDFPGFSSTKEQFSSLPILKNKLLEIKSMEKSNNTHLQDANVKVISSRTCGKAIIRQSSRGSICKFKKVYENSVNYKDQERQVEHILQPIENYNNKRFFNFVNTRKAGVTPRMNIISITNPFVPLERLTDSIITAANKGYKVHFGDKWNLDHNYSRKDYKVTGMDTTNIDRSVLFTPMETKISDAFKGLENRENMKENISISLRRLKQCAYCHFKTKCRITMNKHLRSHEVNEISPLKKTNYVSEHQRKVKIFSCNICSFKSEFKMAVNEHQYIKHSDQKFQSCKLCSFKCDVPSIMKKHIFFHEKKKIFKCNLCHFSSLKQSEILNHKKQCNLVRQVKPNINNQFIGDFYRGTLASSCSSSDVKDDKRLPLDFDNCDSFKCQFCAYTSISKSAIKGHEAYHSFDEEPFKCNFCPYRSAIRALVKCHEMTHVI